MSRRVFLICTGAGAGAQQAIWATPGCSDYLVGAAFPYAKEEQDDLLGFEPTGYVNEDTAIRFAMAAYGRAWRPDGRGAVGVGLTASVASKTSHRGAHRIHAAMMNDVGCWTWSQELDKATGGEARRADGALADLMAVSLSCAGQTMASLELKGRMFDAQARSTELFFERPLFTRLGRREQELPPRCSLMPGAFNPPHAGHFGIAEELAISMHRVVFQITADTPHKPALTVQEMLQRARLLRGHDVLFTRGDPLYIDKARRFPGRHFVMGADAMLRMLDPKWGPDPKVMLYEFAQLGTGFFVSPRNGLSVNQVLEKTGTDAELGELFTELRFTQNITSTDLRGGK